MQKRVSLKIYGRVQGVFFRQESRQKAQALGLSGYVKNEPDGTVLILAEGDKASLEEFANWCQKGPRLADVAKMETRWQKSTGELRDFTISH
ncbi:acylphosphatase [Candidatus Nomurabacteria bacterium]|nr:acylphosphatase [Candidatus Nomurabacteria bacterium]